jgi:hypothetical protein
MKLIDSTSESQGFTSLYFGRALAWYGWKPSRAVACPLSVVRQRCRLEECICQNRAFDHSQVWTDPARPAGERTVFTCEPYEAPDLDRLRRVLAPYGLQMNELPRSMWWPGTTRLYAVDLPGVPNRFAARGGALAG